MLWNILTGIWEKRSQLTQLPFSIRFVPFFFDLYSWLHAPIREWIYSLQWVNSFSFLTGFRSYWSALSVWGWIWWYWDCNSSTIYYTFYGRNTGYCQILLSWLLLSMFEMSNTIGIVSFFVKVVSNVISATFSPGFVCPGAVGLAWYAFANPLHLIMARQSLLLWDNLATTWSLQVSSLLIVDHGLKLAITF